MLTHYMWWVYNFWFMPTFSGMQLGHKTGAGCIWTQYSFPGHGVPSVWNRKVINFPGTLCSRMLCLFITFCTVCCCLGTGCELYRYISTYHQSINLWHVSERCKTP
jgi:hypothetical protein